MNPAAQVKTSPVMSPDKVLRFIGECSGPERIRRLFRLFFPGWTYARWAGERGFKLCNVKSAFSFNRTSGAAVELVRERFARDCHLPLDVVWVKPVSQAAARPA